MAPLAAAEEAGSCPLLKIALVDGQGHAGARTTWDSAVDGLGARRILAVLAGLDYDALSPRAAPTGWGLFGGGGGGGGGA